MPIAQAACSVGGWDKSCSPPNASVHRTIPPPGTFRNRRKLPDVRAIRLRLIACGSDIHYLPQISISLTLTLFKTEGIKSWEFSLGTYLRSSNWRRLETV